MKRTWRDRVEDMRPFSRAPALRVWLERKKAKLERLKRNIAEEEKEISDMEQVKAEAERMARETSESILRRIEEKEKKEMEEADENEGRGSTEVI